MHKKWSAAGNKSASIMANSDIRIVRTKFPGRFNAGIANKRCIFTTPRMHIYYNIYDFVNNMKMKL
jgi:hypothetical protein